MNRMTRSLFLVVLLFTSGLQAQSPVQIVLEPFVSGLSAPVDLAHADDERLFVVERLGTIKIIQPDGTVLPTNFLNITSRVNSANSNEKGLLGLAFDPDYADNGYFYVNYTGGTGIGLSTISRFSVTANPNVADPNSEVILYTVEQPYTNHNGGDLDFGPDGYLYVAFGDGGSANDPPNNGQTLTDNALGDMIRIDVRGAAPYEIPATNPWATLGNDTLPEIWASGLRNPFRFGFDALTGDLWIGDVGQGAQEEVDFWPAGDNSGPNFGWRCYEGTIATPGIGGNCPPYSDFIAPVSIHTHSAGWCSVIGGRVYRGTEYPRLYGRYLYSDYCPASFFSLRPNGSGGFIRENVLQSNGGVGTACIAENSALELFVANVETGTVKRIVDQCPMPAPVITQGEFTLNSSEALSYIWYLDGVVIPGATSASIEPVQNGSYTVLAEFNATCDLLSEPFVVTTVGIQDRSGAAFGVHPVPARDILNVTGIPVEGTSVRLTDTAGRMVLEQVLNHTERITLNVGAVPAGNYFVSILTKDGASIGRTMVSIVR